MNNTLIVNYQQQIFTLQKKILFNLCFCLYSAQELCLLSFILARIQKNGDTRLQEVSKKFLNHERMMEGLKAGKFIRVVDKQKYQNEKNSEVYTAIEINQDLFTILGSVCQSIREQLMKKKKNIEENNDKVQCAKCGKKREKYQLGFILCDCQSDQVIIINADNSQKLEQIRYMQQLMNRTTEWIDQLIAKKKELSVYKASLQNNQFVSTEATDMKEVMKRVDRKLDQYYRRNPDKKSLWNFDQLKNNGYYVRKAQREYKPKRQYIRINELENIRKRRKAKNQK